MEKTNLSKSCCNWTNSAFLHSVGSYLPGRGGGEGGVKIILKISQNPYMKISKIHLAGFGTWSLDKMIPKISWPFCITNENIILGSTFTCKILLQSLNNSNGIQTYYHLVCKRTLNHLAKFVECRFTLKRVNDIIITYSLTTELLQNLQWRN